MLRAAVEAQSALGLAAKAIMDQGNLVSDAVIIELVKQRIAEPDCQKGFLLDGFPRTLRQAEALREENIHLDYVIELQVDDNVIVERMSGRLVHYSSGRVYHRLYHPPKIAGFDDLTNEPLVQRQDDVEDTVRKRLAVYHEQTKLLITYYQQLAYTGDKLAPHFYQVSAQGSVEEVRERLMTILNSETKNILALTQQNFDAVISKNEIVVVDFWAKWCVPCRSFNKVIYQLAKRYPDIIFANIDVDEQKELAMEFLVKSVPAIMILRHRVMVFADSGALNYNELVDLIEQVRQLNSKALEDSQKG